jgi:outer membrane protein assembly factor BamB
VFGDTLYLSDPEGDDAGNYPLVAVDAATGEERWRYPVGAETREPPALAGGTVYLPAVDGRVHAVGPDGERRWVRSVGEHATALHANGSGVVAATRGSEGAPHGLTALAPDGTRRWSFAHPRRLTRAAVVDERAYVGTGGGFVVALG